MSCAREVTRPAHALGSLVQAEIDNARIIEMDGSRQSTVDSRSRGLRPRTPETDAGNSQRGPADCRLKTVDSKAVIRSAPARTARVRRWTARGPTARSGA